MNGYTKVISYFVSGLVISMAMFLFAIQPFMNKISVLADEEVKAQTELQVLEQQILAYNTARSDLSKAENKDLLYSFFVDDKNLKTPIEEMEAAARLTGSVYQMKILKDSLVPEPQTAGRRTPANREVEETKVTSQNTLGEVPYTLSIQNTSYAQLVYFFDYLEHIPHFTEVSGIDISYAENEETGANYINAVIDGVLLVKQNAN